MAPRLSVIVPVLNEAECLAATLADLQPLRQAGHEVIVVDGGSRDATVAVARPLADRVLLSARGRARQMNAGARAARHGMLWFVHADTRVPAIARQAVVAVLAAEGPRWGRFDVRLSGKRRGLRVIGWFMNQRSRLTGIATGDQAMFVERRLFESLGGFPDIPLMEDVALSAGLKRRAPPLCLRTRIITSSRRWEHHGVMRTMLLMWILRLGYSLGVDPRRLARLYGQA